MRLSLSYTLGRPVAAPDEVAELVRDRPRMKYQTRPATIARPRMIQSQLAPPSSAVAGAAGAAGVAGVVCARASFNATSVATVEIWSVFSMMLFPLPSRLTVRVT